MKKSTDKKPLRLALETVRALDTVTLAAVAGGRPPPTLVTCAPTMCTSCM